MNSYFESLFGKKWMLTDTNSDWSPISGGDLTAVFKFAEEAQQQYVGSRLSHHHNPQISLSEGFLFLLTQAALFYTNETVMESSRGNTDINQCLGVVKDEKLKLNNLMHLR